MKTFMSSCPQNVKDDWATVGTWFQYWKAQGEMKVYGTAYKNLVSNMSTLKSDISVLEADWDKSDWYDAAVEASTIAKLALPLPPSRVGAAVTCGDFSLTTT